MQSTNAESSLDDLAQLEPNVCFRLLCSIFHLNEWHAWTKTFFFCLFSVRARRDRGKLYAIDEWTHNALIMQSLRSNFPYLNMTFWNAIWTHYRSRVTVISHKHKSFMREIHSFWYQWVPIQRYRPLINNNLLPRWKSKNKFTGDSNECQNSTWKRKMLASSIQNVTEKLLSSAISILLTFAGDILIIELKNVICRLNLKCNSRQFNSNSKFWIEFDSTEMRTYYL